VGSRTLEDPGWAREGVAGRRRMFRRHAGARVVSRRCRERGAGARASTVAAPQAERSRMGAQVESWGYEALPVSAATGAGLPELARALAGRVSVLAGPSGVGKSALINALTVRAAGARLRCAASLSGPSPLLALCPLRDGRLPAHGDFPLAAPRQLAGPLPRLSSFLAEALAGSCA